MYMKTDFQVRDPYRKLDNKKAINKLLVSNAKWLMRMINRMHLLLFLENILLISPSRYVSGWKTT